ncbi:hypothetical protein EDD66_101140 [Mobilisporobacter senegalensis]|uniref:Uncharacterized protein n=1 Tax=Mobilisporobacter senegalensis TaxID=1329262 RepID=A0A3N1XY32_9FIRM|nr:hypothetical protein [Mobilisporobacter senegalensis]ROR31523.1 hypothetical protein EDD66_101140 [Mobilisporobacter senegalensis]
MEKQILNILGEIQGQISCIQTDVQGLKTDVQGLKTDVQGLKTDVQGLKTDVQELKVDVSELKSDMANVKSDIKDLQMNQSHFDSELRNVRIFIENDVMRKIDLLYENRDTVISRIDKIDRMDKTEEDIALLKIAVSANSRDIKELQNR